MDFSKYEACGNDFIMLDCRVSEPEMTPARARYLCDRHNGIGADGVIMLLPTSNADARMRIINSDGSDAEMCGNGVRALFLFALDVGAVEGAEMSVETPAGLRIVKRTSPDTFEVDMGEPRLARGSVLVEGPAEEDALHVMIDVEDVGRLDCRCVSMGNPHCVIFVDDLETYPVRVVGPLIERSSSFTERTNVEFVKVVGSDLEARVWERGAGETQACGTGACAALVAASSRGLIPRKATVSLPGGHLYIEWKESVFMTGPARRVFEGRIDLER
jgi:diaminopimelate epimerase